MSKNIWVCMLIFDVLVNLQVEKDVPNLEIQALQNPKLFGGDMMGVDLSAMVSRSFS